MNTHIDVNIQIDTEIPKIRYAFIDVQNTETTALKTLNFQIDWIKLLDYLETRWNCQKVFFYPGIQHGDDERGAEFSALSERGAIVRPKYYYVYKNQDRIAKIMCPTCDTEILHRMDMGTNWKCNCDVELTVDILENVRENTEIMLFTGDGDFEFLIHKVIEKGGIVTLVSSAKKIRKGPQYFISRLSTKLRKLTEEDGINVRFLEMDNLKYKLQKENI